MKRCRHCGRPIRRRHGQYMHVLGDGFYRYCWAYGDRPGVPVMAEAEPAEV